MRKRRVVQQISAHGALGLPSTRIVAPLWRQLKHWLEQQFEERTVEPNSSLGKAFHYLLTHWQTLTRFLEVSGRHWRTTSWSGR